MARILIVEDDPTYAQVIAHALRAAGHAPEVAYDGHASLKRLRESAPDLALLDVIMPGMDGYALARVMKADPATAQVPIIFITGVTDTQREVMGLELGANDYITKPFRRTELLARIGVALRIRELEEALRRNNEELALLARTDPLTELPNRRVFDERLSEEWTRSRRYSRPLSALMADVDNFREVNDALLHAGGDRVLCAIARCLRAHLRSNDLVARVGGEEFAVLCPETEVRGAHALAERMRLATARLHHDGTSPVLVTVSIGVAMAPPGSEGTAEELMLAADAALREAKHAGRNRVVTAQEPAR